MTGRLLRRALPPLVSFALLLAVMPLTAPLFHAAFPALERPLYQRAGFASLALNHLALVAMALLAAGLVGVGAGLLATRPGARRALPTVLAVCALGQTFPPVAVLAVAVPLLGYGALPTLIALAVYALLPIAANTIAGLDAVDPGVREAARGMGFRPLRQLMSVELPLAAPVVVAGLRTAAIISVGTAAIGSTVGAETLGSPIIEGLSGSNVAYVLQGSVLVAGLALAVDGLFAALALAVEP